MSSRAYLPYMRGVMEQAMMTNRGTSCSRCPCRHVPCDCKSLQGCNQGTAIALGGYVLLLEACG
jgi:hypothetical protein